MTHFDDTLQHGLAMLADEMPASDITDATVRRGQQLRLRRRSLMATTGIAGVVAAIVVPLTLVGQSSQHLAGTGPRPESPPPGTPAVSDRSFNVAPPMLRSSTPLTLPRPKCQVDDVHASAQLQRTPSGVVGVITARSKGCAIPANTEALTLLDARGAPLGIPVVGNANTTNPGGYMGASFALHAGRASIGFAWIGSWCGASARSVRLTLTTGDLDVPLTGPQPGCEGSSHSTLIAGATGRVGAPVQSPPAQWRALTARLAVAPTSLGAALTGLRVTFTNPTARPIPLLPIPTYVIGVRDKVGDGTDAELQKPLPYLPEQLVVPAGGALTLHLPDTDISADSANFTSRVITVTFEIAGVAPATAHTQVR